MVTLASKRSASLTASCSSASGPSTLAGALTRSRPKAIASRDALNSDRVDLVGRDEARLWRLVRLEAVVSIKREQEAERGEIGVSRRIGEPVDAFGQRRRELAGRERVARRGVRFVDPEQDAGERARLAREKLQASGFRLKAAMFGEGRGGRADRRFDRRPVFRADQPDRRRVGRWRSECEQGLKPPSDGQVGGGLA